MIELVFHIKPEGKGRPRFSRFSRPYTPEKTRIYEDCIKRIAITQMQDKRILQGAISVTVVFFFQRPDSSKNKCVVVKPDLDNLQKGVFDALNGIVWKDDSQIVEVWSQKIYVDSEPKIFLRATEDEATSIDIPVLRNELLWREPKSKS